MNQECIQHRIENNGESHFHRLCREYFSSLMQSGFNTREAVDRNGTEYFSLTNTTMRIDIYFDPAEIFGATIGPNAIGTTRRRQNLIELLESLEINFKQIDGLKKRDSWFYFLIGDEQTQRAILEKSIFALAEAVHTGMSKLQTEIKQQVQRYGAF